MIDFTKFLEYLKIKLPEFEKTQKKGQILFTCPNIGQHKYKGKSPTATTIPGTDNKIYCLQCNWKGNVYDIVRLLENKPMTDGEVMDFLINSLKLDNYPELELYQKYGWSFLPIAKNGKIPLEKDWTNKTHKDKSEILKWIEGGLNLGIRTGEVSGITVIDADLKVAPSGEYEEIYKELTASKTLIQNTPHGKHFIFKYDKEIKQTSKIAGVTIDIRNDGGQILCSPSKINNLNYTWVNLGSDIKVVPEIVKSKLLENKKISTSETETLSKDLPQQEGELPKLKNNNLQGQGNDSFIKFLGFSLSIGVPIEKIESQGLYLNREWWEHPMPTSAIKSMIGSLEGYKMSEEQTQAKAVLECCKLLQCDISAKDVMEHTNLKRAIVDKYLAKLHKEGKLVRKGRGRYELKQQVEWTDEDIILDKEINFDMPYFDKVAIFHTGDILLLGAPTGGGKTHIAMNIIAQLQKQGIKPYYISLESGSRHSEIAKKLHLEQKNYFISKEPIDNPIQIELIKDAVTIIDWIYLGEDFAQTQAVFKHLNDEIARKGGILIVFTQLKEESQWFAVNLIKSFASFAARFMYKDRDKRDKSFWLIDKIRDPIGNYPESRVNCKFDFETKILEKDTNEY
jgi:hypothetical protein